MRWVGVIAFLLNLVACGSQPSGPEELPSRLEVEFSREAAGSPIVADEVLGFSQEVRTFWQQSEYFAWILRHSHGMDATYSPSLPNYKLWFYQTRAVKEGALVTFRHDRASDNLMIRHSKVVGQLLSGHHLGNAALAQPLNVFLRGVDVLFDGMQWSTTDAVQDGIMARAVYARNHSYQTADGRSVAVDYTPMRTLARDSTAHTVHNPANPLLGDIWVRNIRSKDDVPHIYRMVPLLMLNLAEEADTPVRLQMQTTLNHLVAFASDILAQGYYIRTKEDGEAYTPDDSLANFVAYDVLLEGAECNAKLATSLVATGQPLDNACGSGFLDLYENLAGAANYYNWHIARYFHLAALSMTLLHRENSQALEYLQGMAARADDLLDNVGNRNRYTQWDADAAAFLVVAAAWGLPLTADEVRLIHERYRASFAWYANHPHWDLWDASVPDGEYAPVPGRTGPEGASVTVDELAFFLEYCRSPFKNPSGQPLVDCAVLTSAQ